MLRLLRPVLPHIPRRVRVASRHRAARARVRIVERKLEGAHPSHLTLADLRGTIADNVKKELIRSKSGWEAVTDIVLGAADSDRRAMPEDGLSAEQQVRALVEQATDPNILGRTWAGWLPFV